MVQFTEATFFAACLSDWEPGSGLLTEAGMHGGVQVTMLPSLLGGPAWVLETRSQSLISYSAWAGHSPRPAVPSQTNTKGD